MLKKVNSLFPGKPNYKGPTKGYFTLLHHEILVEWSDNVMERIDYIKEEKEKSERPIRLSHIVYLPEKMCPQGYALRAKGYALCAKGDALWDDKKVLAYLKLHVKDCVWNGATLVFPS